MELLQDTSQSHISPKDRTITGFSDTDPRGHMAANQKKKDSSAITVEEVVKPGKGK